MSQPTIHVTIVDAAGTQRTFEVRRTELDCGMGCIDIRPGKPAFCRGFDHGVLTLDDGAEVTTLKITNGMASLTGDAVHVICEQVSDATLEAFPSPLANNSPVQPTGTKDTKQ